MMRFALDYQKMRILRKTDTGIMLLLVERILVKVTLVVHLCVMIMVQ